MEEQKYTRNRLMLFKELGAAVAVRAGDAVGRLLGYEVPVTEINSGLIRLDTLMRTDHPDQEAVAICTRVQGNAPGYAVFMFPYRNAPELIYAMGSQHSPGPINTDPLYVLQEVGEMLVSSALGELADKTGLTIRPTNVQVIVDMAAAVVSSLVAVGLGNTDRALTVGFHFGGDPGIMDGLFLYLPEPGSLDAIESACSRSDVRRIPMDNDMSYPDVQLLHTYPARESLHAGILD